MGCFRNIDEAREYFTGDRFATVNGMTIEEMEDGRCVCRARVREEHRNALGGIMGGFLFTLCDFAYAVCINNAHRPCTGMDADIRYLNASKGSELTAEARLLKDGRTVITAQVIVTDEFGKQIALFTGSGFKL